MSDAEPTQEEFYGREVILATREMVEMESDEILADAQNVDVCFLVVGDPFGSVSFLSFRPRLFRGRSRVLVPTMA